MEWWQAVILGLVEGLTEYLPVSSTGHLILAQRAMGIENSDAANAYAIAIQGGAILAVLWLYFGRIKGMTLGMLGRDPAGKRLAWCLIAALLPLAGIVPLNHLIEKHLFGLWPVTIAWFVGGMAILIVSWLYNGKVRVQGAELADMTWKMALVIGLAQCVAVWPGTSRSLVTIVVGVLVGLRLVAAVEFSFLLGVATLGGATIFKVVTDGRTMLENYTIASMAIGTFFAFISAVVAIKWMVAYLQKHGLSIFGYYRVALAVVVAGLIMADILEP